MMSNHRKELRRWKALAVFFLLLLFFLVVNNANQVKVLSDKVNSVEAANQKTDKELHKVQEENTKLNKELEQAKRDKADAEAKAISRQRAVGQSAGSGTVQLLGSCNITTHSNVAYTQADTQLVSQEIDRVFGSQAHLAKAVFQSESGLRSNACSPTNDWGVAQVNHPAHPQYTIEQLMNYQVNIQAAWEISNHGTNFNPWSDFKNGNYIKYL